MDESTFLLLAFGSLVFFIFGAAIGSFLNVVILRFGSGKDLSGRSFCPECKHQLAILDLVPVFSYIYLQGKCHYCHKRISKQYPLVELSAALLFSFAFIFVGSSLLGFSNSESVFGTWLGFAYLLFFSSVLLVLSVFDFKKGIIPDKILLPSILIATIFLLLSSLTKANEVFEVMRLVTLDLFAAFAIAVFFLLLILVTKGRGMGGGDFKLSIFIGLSLGWPLAFVGILLGFLTGASAAVMLILVGKKVFGQTIPFGPFLALGAYLSALWGSKLLEMYLNTLGL